MEGGVYSFLSPARRGGDAIIPVCVCFSAEGKRKEVVTPVFPTVGIEPTGGKSGDRAFQGHYNTGDRADQRRIWG